MTGFAKQQDQIWQLLHDQITETLMPFGAKDAFGKGDYGLLDENWGWKRHQIEVQNLRLLHPTVIARLRSLLRGYPDWDITVRVDVPGKEDLWPGMGIIICCDAVIDELRREYLPQEIQEYSYG